jgi:peptidoglycan hydrolase-like protein with peptidoglycan-binding domain
MRSDFSKLRLQLLIEGEKMFATNKTVRAAVVLVFLTIGMLSLSLTAAASAANPTEALSHGDINKVQKSLSGKGFYHGPIDGVLGPRTRQAIGEYQKSEKLPVTKQLDAETAGKLGVGSESIGGKFKGAGHEVGAGGKEAGHEIQNGKPVAAGKELGKGIGRAGKDVGQGIKKAVSPDSDREDREKK